MLFTVPVGGAQNVGGYNTSETSLHVTWKHLLEEDTDGIITGYEVFYALDDGNNNWQSVKVVGKDTLFVDIPGLEWFADYLITVSGENAVGVGAKSAAITLRTDEWSKSVCFYFSLFYNSTRTLAVSVMLVLPILRITIIECEILDNIYCTCFPSAHNVPLQHRRLVLVENSHWCVPVCNKNNQKSRKDNRSFELLANYCICIHN